MSKISVPAFVRRAFFAASVTLAAPVSAQDNARLDNTVYGSEQTLAPLRPYMDLFRKTAQTDVIVVSSKDLLNNAERSQQIILNTLGVQFGDSMSMKERAARYRALLHPYMDQLNLSPDAKNALPEFIMGRHFQLVANSKAFAFNARNFSKEQEICLVGAPDENASAQILLTRLAGLPDTIAPLLKTDITSEELYLYIMLHEAAHCAQFLKENTGKISKIDTDFHKLNAELDADDVAFEQIRKLYEHMPERAESMITFFKQVRTLSNLHNAGSLLFGKQYYLTHGAPIEIDNKKSSPDELILVTGALKTLINLSVGFIYAEEVGKHGQDYLLSSAWKMTEDINLDKNYATNFLKRYDGAGAYILAANPSLMYAIVKNMNEILSENNFENQIDTPVNIYFSMGQRMIEDYMLAYDTLFPHMQHEPIVSALSQDLAQRVKETSETNQNTNTASAGYDIERYRQMTAKELLRVIENLFTITETPDGSLADTMPRDPAPTMP